MSCLRAIGRVVSEFARLILFVASIVFLLSSLLLLAFNHRSQRDFSYAQVEHIDTGLSLLVGLSVYLVALAILGALVSFFSSKGTIKLLALVLALNVILGLVVLANSAPKMEEAYGELEAKFKGYLAQYDWQHAANGTGLRLNATRAWDLLQTDSHCCGLNSPDDWADSRPPKLAAEMLPISCCQRNATATVADSLAPAPLYCNAKLEKHWPAGCSIEMESALVAVQCTVVALISFSLVLGVLCALVLLCKPPTRSHFEHH